MKLVSAIVGVWVGGMTAVAPPSESAPPVFVVRLHPAAERPVSGRQPTGTPPDTLASSPWSGRQLQPLPVSRLDDSSAAAILDAPRPLALRFSTPVPVRQVLMMLVRDTGLSLATSADAEETFAGELTGVTLRQALDLVVKPQGLDYRIEGNAIRVFRRETITRILDVNAISARRGGNDSGDTFDDLGTSLTAFLSSAGRLGVDRKAGLVHLTDYPENVERAARYLESLQRRLNRQVDIEARVVEVVLPDGSAAPVNWNDALGRARAPGAGGNTVDFGRFLAALGTQGTVTVLTAADVKTLHNERATVRLGVASSAFADLELSVTPHIGADGTILMSVAPTLSRAVAEVPGTRSPAVVATSEVSTAVRVRDGETLVLPGIRRARSEIAILITTKVI